MADTVLVTGGAGFIGSTLVDRLLAEGRRVVAVDDLTSGRLANLAQARGDYPGAFEFHRLDIRGDALDAIIARHRPGVVFHLAGARAGAGDVVGEAMTNVVGTIRVLEAACRGGVRKVTASSWAGVGRSGSPRSPADAGRRAAADYVRGFGASTDLAWTVLALSDVYGPRQSPDGGAIVARLMAQALAGEPGTLAGDGTQVHDLVHVDDVVDALARTISAGDGHDVEIGTGVPTTAGSLFAAIAAATGAGGEPVFTPGTGDDVSPAVADPALAAAVLGWRPFTPIDEGLANTLRWQVDA